MTWNKNINKLLRNWHRDIGYFAVAISLIYGISGILLTHKDVFPVISTIETIDTFSSQLDIAGFSEQWSQQHSDKKLTKCFISDNSIKFYCDGGKGKYTISDGAVSFESYKKHGFTRFFTQFHLNQHNGWKYIADLFCVSLIFLALSGLFMVKGKNSFKRRGWWFVLIGIVLVVVFVVL